MSVPPSAVTDVVHSASSRAKRIETSRRKSRTQEGGEPGGFDVWSHSMEGAGDRLREATPATDSGAAGSPSKGRAPGDPGELDQADRETRTNMVDEFEVRAGLREADEGKESQGALEAIGATFGALTSLEQLVSAPFAAIPFPAFPALRVTDMDVGLPHAHTHPPNLVPPAPPTPFPSTGPIIPIPFLSGATQTLINGLPAARCGDMGLGIWCGGYFPMYEVFLGSSSVWIEGARAGRLLVDVTHHCMFSAPKPSDPPLGPPVGMTITASPNVLIGGVPLPSLLDLAMGAAMKGLFGALGKAAKKIRANRAARATRARGGSVKAFSRVTHGSGFKSIWDFHPKVIHRVFVRDFRDLVRKFQRRVEARPAFKSPEAFKEAFERVDELLNTGAIRIDPWAGKEFREAVIKDLQTALSTKTGRKVFDDILENKLKHGTQVTIAKKVPGGTNHCNFNTSAVVDTKSGTMGTPSDSRIVYNPVDDPPTTPGSTSDCTLLHEAVHAGRAGRGTSYSDAPLGSPVEEARWTDVEEMETIAIENMHREERGLPLRDGHDDMP